MNGGERVKPTVLSNRVSFSKIDARTRASGTTSYRVRWTVAGRRHEMWASSYAEAEFLRARLLAAKADGELWQPSGGGLPKSLVGPDRNVTLLDLATAVIDARWDGWSTGHRSTCLEAMSRLLSLAVVNKRGAPSRQALRMTLRNIVLPPEGFRKKVRPKDVAPEDVINAVDFLERGLSLPISDLSPRSAVDLLEAAEIKPDGTRYARDGRMHLRTFLRLIVRAGLDCEAISNFPLDCLRTPRKTDDARPTRSRVPSPAQARVIVNAVCSTRSGAISPVRTRRYRAFLTVAWTAGLRPSEIRGLRLEDVTLPATGWGQARVSTPTIVTERRLTGTAANHVERSAPKGRCPGEVREVPLPPEAVQALLLHLQLNKVDAGGRLFTHSDGGPITQSGLGSVWRAGLRRIPGEPWKGLRMYHLRHTAATWQLEADELPKEVARRMGHSVTVLMDVYASWFDDETGLATSRMDAVLAV